MTGESAPDLTPAPDDGRRIARSLPYTSLLYNVETETMMSTEIETRVRGGIVIPCSVCGGVE